MACSGLVDHAPMLSTITGRKLTNTMPSALQVVPLVGHTSSVSMDYHARNTSGALMKLAVSVKSVSNQNVRHEGQMGRSGSCASTTII